MNFFRWGTIGALLAILGAASYQTLLWLGVMGYLNEAQVRPLDGNDQEVALIEPATNSEDWGRLVTALQLLEMDWPKINPNLPVLQVALENAFPRLTADVPEIALSLSGHPERSLRLRWYKISGEHDAPSWVRKLHERPRQPLAIIGGGSSDRAVRLAVALKRTYPAPAQPSPILLLTTATAERTIRGNPLIGIYQDRTFRFSFTNKRMVEALLQFVQHRQFGEEDKKWAQNLWVNKPANPELMARAVASMVGVGDVAHAWGVLRRYPYLQPYTMHAVSWQDERYSLDLTETFEKEFKKNYPLSEFFLEDNIRHGVGEFFQATPQEQVAVGTFLARPTPTTPHSFLVLPTTNVRMRRFLINLRERSQHDARNLVVFNGDAISFHAVYRDREVLWNILNLPYSLVFFSHRNPIDHEAGFVWTRDDRAESETAFPQRTTTGTQDILLYRDLFETLIYAVFDRGQLLDDPLQVRQRLRATRWRVPALGHEAGDSPRVGNPEAHDDGAEMRPFFDSKGDRQSHTGEHIVWVKPIFFGDRVDLTSKISVWTTRRDANGGTWELVESFDAQYNQSR